MRVKDISVDESAVLSSEPPWEGTKILAGLVAREANEATRAKVGITFNDSGQGLSRRLVIGPTGAAAVPVEFGHQGVPGKRFFKRAIDSRRVG